MPRIHTPELDARVLDMLHRKHAQRCWLQHSLGSIPAGQSVCLDTAAWPAVRLLLRAPLWASATVGQDRQARAKQRRRWMALPGGSRAFRSYPSNSPCRARRSSDHPATGCSPERDAFQAGNGDEPGTARPHLEEVQQDELIDRLRRMRHEHLHSAANRMECCAQQCTGVRP